MKNESIEIVVVSCDKYFDVWYPFFTLFNRYWEDCPYDISLISNFKEYKSPKIRTIKTGEDISWTINLVKGLQEIRAEYVLLLLDDFLLYKKIDNNTFVNLFNNFKKLNGNYLRLDPSPLPNGTEINNYGFGEILPGTRYRTSLKSAIWEKSILLNIVSGLKTAWEVELLGSDISAKLYKTGFYSTYSPIIYAINSIDRGQWSRNHLSFFKKENIQISTNNIPLQSIYKHFIQRINYFVYIYLKNPIKNKINSYFPKLAQKYRYRKNN